MADIVLLDQQIIQSKNENLSRKADALAVVTANDLHAAQELLKAAQQWGKYIEEQRAAAVRPLIDKKAEIDGLAKQLSAPVTLALEVIKGKIVRYQQEVERKELERRNEVNSCIAAIRSAQDEASVDAALAALPFDDAAVTLEATQRKNALKVAAEQKAEAERQAKEAKRLADIAKKQGEEAAALAAEKQKVAAEARRIELEKQEAARRAQEALQAQQAESDKARAAAIATVQSAKGIRKEPRFEIVDASKLPRRFLAPDEKAIRAAVKSEEGVKWEEFGLRVWEETTVR